ncbi:MAG: phage protease, partial [Archaeoglobaceae archaeon]
MAKVYAKRRVLLDINNDGEKEDCTAFLLAGSFVVKLRKMPPKRMIQEWRKADIKPGVTANVAILKSGHEGPEGGRTVLTSIWYDLANLREVHEDTLELIYSMLKEVPEEKMTEEQKKALEYIEKRLDERLDKIVFTQKLSVEGKKQVWVCVLPYGEFHDPRYGKVKITKEMCEQMVKNFKAGVPHYEPPVNISHKDEMGAFGVVKDLEVREDGLWALLELTAEGAELVEKERFRYLSAEFAEHYTDKRTGKDVGYV